MGFNSRFTTKPAMAKSAVKKPSVAKFFANSVDECKVKEHTLLRPSDRSRQSEAPCANDSRSFSPKIPRLGKEEISVVAAGAILLLLFSALPGALPLGVIGRSTILLGAALQRKARGSRISGCQGACLDQIPGKCDGRDINYVLTGEKCYRQESVLTKWCGKTMMHSELGYRLLRAEQVSLEKQIIWSLSRWRVYGDRDDFKRGMTGLDQLALLKSLDAMRDDRSFF